MDAPRDRNHLPTILGQDSTDPTKTIPLKINPVTGRVLVEIFGGGGQVDEVVGGTNISVDSSDPTAPIVSLALGSDENFVTDAEKSSIATISDKAPLASPTFTGTPSAPTATAGDSTTLLATTEFVQSAVRSVPSKEACKYATTTALATVTYANGTDGVGATLTGVALGAIGVDSNSPIVGDRILVKNQVSTFQNGIYTVTATGSGISVFVLTRSLDFNQSQDVKTGASSYITNGTVNAATTWDVTSADSPIIGTDAITFVQVAGPGSIIAGTGISISGVTVSVTNPATGTNTGDETAARIGALIGGSTDATPNDTDYVATALTGGGVLKKITWTNVKAFLKAYFDTIYAKYLGDADFYKYQISRTVDGSGNLTVSLLNYLGATPSVTAPVKVQIGDTVRTITGALSRVVSAGGNHFNAGSAELATKEIDYFAYLSWDSTDNAVRIGFSRIGYGITFGDFINVFSSEKFIAFDNDPNTTDQVVNIGRFNAILSGGAGYTWSVPSVSVIINSPTFTGNLVNKGFSQTTSITTSFSPDMFSFTEYYITAQAGALLFSNPTGVYDNGRKIIIRVKDNGTARALTYDTQYRAVGVTLPTTTVISKTLYIGGIWNTTDTKLDVVAVAQES